MAKRSMKNFGSYGISKLRVMLAIALANMVFETLYFDADAPADTSFAYTSKPIFAAASVAIYHVLRNGNYAEVGVLIVAPVAVNVIRLPSVPGSQTKNFAMHENSFLLTFNKDCPASVSLSFCAESVPAKL